MVGVSNPIMRRDWRGGWRFLVGFGAGLAGSAAALAGPLALLWFALRFVPGRVWVMIALVAVLGVADLRNRTPHVRRQVPQRFAAALNHQPGRLGFIWALDLGLLVTTQKTTSLLWIALAGAVLLGTPTTIVLTLAVAAACYWLTTAVMVVTGDAFLAEPPLVNRLGGWGGVSRRIAGAAGLGLAAAMVVSGL